MTTPLSSVSGAVLAPLRRQRPTFTHYPGRSYVERTFGRARFPAGPLAAPPPGSDLRPVMGERGLPVLGKTLQFLALGPVATLDHHRRYGPVSWSSLFGMRVVTVVGPDACQVVLANKDKAFSQDGWNFFIGPFFTRGLMLLDGDEHHLHRRVMQEAFTRDRLESYLVAMRALIDDEVPRWPVDEELLLYPAIKDLSLDVATTVFMGAEPGEETDEVAAAFVDCVRAGLALVRRPVPGLRWHRGLKARARLEEYFRARVDAKRESDDADLFAALCHARTEDGQAFGDDSVVNHMIFLMMAAHDTTTITATTICYFLARHPEWQERCREESMALADTPLDLAAVDRLASLDLVFAEAMRLVTPVPALGRRAVRDTEILGHFVPAGTMVSVGAWASHLLPELWSSPDEFDPLRFAEPRREDKQARFASIPFGGGVHKCIGMHFGRAEVKALVHRILLTHRIELLPGYQIRWDLTSLPSPDDGLPVVLRPLHRKATS